MAKAWQGRFSGETDERVEQFTESISFDHRLFRQDIQGSTAHARMLAKIGILTSDQAEAIAKTLAEIGNEIEAGNFPFDISKEDIHLHIESALIERLGDVGRKLHTGRSRNDQISTDLRLWVRDQLDELDAELVAMQKALVASAERHRDVIIPGYTHLQRAQPVIASHYFLAYVEKLERDRGRVADCRKRVNVLSLGGAALAGTSISIDRHQVAESLGFADVARNSMDISSDRDFVVEAAFVLSMIAEHLSSWAEEWILWTTTEFDFLKLPDAMCTGSSIMPQKKNPDVLELIRGKTGRVIGALQTLLVLIKGLPLCYNRDLQEDKLPLFDAMETVRASVQLATVSVEGAELNRPVIAARLGQGFLDATTLMEQLIRRGVPMRSAHEAVGKLVGECVAASCNLSDLPDARYDQLLEGIADGQGAAIRATLGVEKAVQAFQSYGSTAPAEVDRQLADWKNRLA